ncbi:MAG TPA: hypothetical protein VMF89_08830 [Polyangiales bacterium]|nr:hypothetical protein [Polyangiales bacterium]
MSRAIHATTPSGDEVTLEANAQHHARGRTVAQVEHNAMQALDLVRATLAALSDVVPAIDRLALLLSNSRGIAVSALAAELQRVIQQIGETIHAAALRDDPLLTGGSAKFAVDDPHDLTSTPLEIDLPDLSHAFAELAGLDLKVTSIAQLTAKQLQLTAEVHAAKKHLGETAQRLSGVLARQRPPREKLLRAEDERFVAMIQSVRQSVLHAGGSALRVQGSPSSRATWLIEALRVLR